jgi:geranylgeranyl pyrophosphate synthase
MPSYERTGANLHVRDRAQRYARQACRALQVLPASPLRDSLIAVAEFCVARGY